MSDTKNFIKLRETFFLIYIIVGFFGFVSRFFSFLKKMLKMKFIGKKGK